MYKRTIKKKYDPDIINFYNLQVVPMIMEKYGYNEMDALRVFVKSETHIMLEDEACGFTMFGAGGVFDIWEAEKVTGDPRNSVYIRGD